MIRQSQMPSRCRFSILASKAVAASAVAFAALVEAVADAFAALVEAVAAAFAALVEAVAAASSAYLTLFRMQIQQPSSPKKPLLTVSNLSKSG